MPRIPIDFSLGLYTDANPELGAREVYNCYPESTPGAVTKTVLRSVEGYAQRLSDINLSFNTGIFVGGVLYYLAGGTLYSSVSPYTASVSIGALPAIHGNSSSKIISNGKTLIIISLGGTLTVNDYYYDISGTTLATIESYDADFASFGKVKDVAYKDGYYVFVTANNIFHGSNSATTDGIDFNALSFAALPSGLAVERHANEESSARPRV